MSARWAAPLSLAGGAISKNRVWLAPLTNQQSHLDGTFGDAELAWLEARAKGGFGGLVSAAAHVHPRGQSYSGQIGAYSDEHVPGLRRFAALSASAGALSILQLVHGGLRSSMSITGEQPVAPSAVDLPFPGFVRPRALSTEEIESIVDEFASAAVRAQTAGLSGIELHAANGYLFTQFLSSLTNQRDDAWGGPIENRSRLLVRTVESIRAVVRADFVIGVRLRAQDTPSQRGFDVTDTLAVVERLNGLGVTYLHLASASTDETSWADPAGGPTNLRRLRRALAPTIRLVANGGILSSTDAEHALGEGADLVALGKAAISAPDWPHRALVPGYRPDPLPMSAKELADRVVSQPFIEYLRTMNLVR